MPDRYLADATPDGNVVHEDVQQLIEAESGKGSQGINRVWQASNSNKVVLSSTAAGVQISRDDGTTAPTHVVNDGTAAGGALAGTYPNPTVAPATLTLICPTGVVLPWAGAATPAGWLLCDGSTVPRSSFPALFAAIGSAYNTGGEAGTQFRLPNLVGRVVLGVSGTHALASSGGNEQPAHTHDHDHDLSGHHHGLNGHYHGLGGHVHGLNAHTHVTDVNHDHPALANITVAATPDASNSIQNGTGSATTVPPYTHTHRVTVDLPTLGQTNVTSGPPSQTNTTAETATSAYTGVEAGSNPPSGSTTGGDARSGTTSTAATWASNALPPYLALNWIIRAA